MPASARRCGARRVMSSPRQSDAAAADLRVAHDGEHERRFADAVSSQHREAAAFRQCKRDAVKHDGGAVAGAHVVEGDERLSHDSHVLCRGLAEIDRAHARIGGDLVRRAFEQNAAADHDDDARGEAKDKLHVVLDEQHRDVARQAGDGGEQFARFPRAARRPPARQATTPSAVSPGERDFEQALLAVSELARRPVADRRQPQRRENVVSLVDLVLVGG